MTTTPGGIAWRAKIFRSFGISTPPALAYTETPQATGGFGLSLPASLTFTNTSNSTASFGLSIPPQFTEQYPATASVVLSAPPTFGFTGVEKYSKSVSLALTPGINFTGTELYSRSYNLSLPPTLGFTGAANVPAVTFDHVSNFSVTAGSSFSGSNTATAGAYVIADIILNSGAGSASTISSVTYGGSNMTLLTSVNLNNNANNGTLFRYGIANVAGGSQTFAASFSSSWYQIVCTSYLNVGSVGSSTTTFGSGASLSQSSVTVSGGKMAAQVFGQGGGGTTLSSLSGGTNRYNNYSSFVGGTVNTATATTAFSGTASGQSSDVWAGIATILNTL